MTEFFNNKNKVKEIKNCVYFFIYLYLYVCILYIMKENLLEETIGQKLSLIMKIERRWKKPCNKI